MQKKAMKYQLLMLVICFEKGDTRQFQDGEDI